MSTENKCRHFNGTQHKCCRAEIPFNDFRQPNGALHLPCLPEYNATGATCPKFDAWTDQEVKERGERAGKHIKMILEGISPCCEASIDESRVIQSGRHKGHGPRFCSKCGKCVYMV